jgi:hypothetical protein
MSKQKYPKEIYVTREKDENISYLNVHETKEEAALIGEKVEVAVYVFSAIVRLSTTIVVLPTPE